jgi:hypothetical protein
MEASFGDGVSFYFCFSSGGEKSCILGLLIRSHEKKILLLFTLDTELIFFKVLQIVTIDACFFS